MSHVNESELAKKFGGVPERSRRERKKPEFFTVQREDKPIVEVGKGQGTELKAIGNVAYRMSKMKADDEVVTFLHRAIFKRPGKGTTRKKAVLSFSGFAFPEAAEVSELQKITEKTAQLPVKVLNAVIALFDLPKGLKEKAAKVESIVNFLKCPAVLSSVDVSQQVKKKRKAPQPKRKSAAKRKSRDDSEEEAEQTEEAEEQSESKPQPKKRARRSRKVEKADENAEEPAAMEEVPQGSPESDDPAPKAEDDDAMDSEPENVAEAKEEKVDDMDSEDVEGNDNDADLKDQDDADNKKGEIPERVEEQETETNTANAPASQTEVTKKGKKIAADEEVEED